MVDDPSVDALALFCAALDGCIEKIFDLAPRPPKPAAQRARRLQRSAEHLVRASQRSFFAGEAREEKERDEVLLHHVIAIEALLSTEKDELTRRVSQRAAALFATDDDRLLVKETVKRAYANRLSYAHGDDTKNYDLE